MCVIVQIIYVVAYQGCIDAWVRIQHGGAVAISFYTAETVPVIWKEGLTCDFLIVVSYVIDIVFICVYVHGGVIAQFMYIAAVNIHGIQPAVVVCIWEKYFTVTFTEEPGIVQITCSITIYIGWIKLYLWYKMVYNKACDAY